MNTLTCPLPVFQRLLRLLTEAPNRPVFLRVGQHHTPSDHEWLVRDVALSLASTPAGRPEPTFRVALASGPPASAPEPSPPAVIGELVLGTARWQGRWWGMVTLGGARESLHRLALIGPGMHRLSAHDPVQLSQPDHRPGDLDLSRWSRTIGALGGEDVWRRLIQLRIGVVGCGRTGSLVTVTLARLGVQEIALIDPDAVEAHNLGEMDAVTEADLGKPKVSAVADHLRALMSPLPMSPLPVAAPVTHPMALSLAKSCDVLVCCADNDAARLATAILATLYHKVLVDVGTGVFYHATSGQAQGRTRTMGADVRLILPGDGCLLCRGSVGDYAQAVDDLCNHRLPTGLQGDWRHQRAGSLRTLNQLAAAVAVQMLQDLVAERLEGSAWMHAEFAEAGHLTVTYPATGQAGSPDCALCAKAGLGDEGLGWAR